MQFLPFPLYPGLHLQVKKGVSSWQMASLWQLCWFVAHSFIAEITETSYTSIIIVRLQAVSLIKD